MKKADRTTGTLGTFAGVFTPSVLTILGIILFLRLGYVVGSAGLGKALVIIGISNTISVLTSFSLAAIATNLKVKGGGDYYLISRTLGLEFGGAIGIVLYLAQSISIAFYCIGFGEALTSMLPEIHHRLPQIIAILAASFLFIFAWLGADWAIRFQYIVMTILGLALISFIAGGFLNWNTANIVSNWASPEGGPGFWTIFAIFFPAVTGFTQGVSMSGDLKDPGKSLPLGTFMAVGISIIVYFGCALLFSGALPNRILSTDYESMNKIAVWGFLINAGVVAATLSSAMASFLGAPRILQSLSSDRIFPFLLPFARGFGQAGNPRRGVLLSAGIAYLTIGLGNLNIIAPIVSMFFLISYGLLNYATYYEASSSSPSFRPTFRLYDYRVSLAGFVACLGVMLAIDLTAGAFAISILFAVYQYLKRADKPSRWADSRRSHYLQKVRENLIAAASEPEHSRDWRPQILVFAEDDSQWKELITFSSWIEGGSGLTTAVRIIEGEGLKMLKIKEEAETELTRMITDNNLKAFPLVMTDSNVKAGINSLVQAFGVGPVKANTILFNWNDTTHRGMPGIEELKYMNNLKAAFRFGLNLIILDGKDSSNSTIVDTPSEKRRIDIWWQDNATGRLMLLLAYLMTRNESWEDSKIRVLYVPDQGGQECATIDGLKKFLEEARIIAEPEIMNRTDLDSIINKSGDSSVVFIPFKLSNGRILSFIDTPINNLINKLHIVSMVLAGKDIDLDAEPETGKQGELAEAADRLSEAEKKVKETEEKKIKAKKEVEQKKEELDASISKGAGDEIEKKEKEVDKAVKEAREATRREAKAVAKLEDALKDAEALGIKTDNKNDNKPIE
jgi:amino acid transporter